MKFSIDRVIWTDQRHLYWGDDVRLGDRRRVHLKVIATLLHISGRGCLMLLLRTQIKFNHTYRVVKILLHITRQGERPLLLLFFRMLWWLAFLLLRVSDWIVALTAHTWPHPTTYDWLFEGVFLPEGCLWLVGSDTLIRLLSVLSDGFESLLVLWLARCARQLGAIGTQIIIDFLKVEPIGWQVAPFFLGASRRHALQMLSLALKSA